MCTVSSPCMCYPVFHEQECSCQYWPEKKGQDMVMGKLQVTLQSEKVGKLYVERKLEIRELAVC